MSGWLAAQEHMSKAAKTARHGHRGDVGSLGQQVVQLAHNLTGVDHLHESHQNDTTDLGKVLSPHNKKMKKETHSSLSNHMGPSSGILGQT